MVLESPEKDWLALSLVTGVGTQTLQKLSETFGSLSKIWQKSSDQLLQLGLRKDVIKLLPKAMDVRSFQMEKRLIESSPNLHLLCPESEVFPTNLLQIHSVPSVLYVKGELPNAHNLCLGVVGSRSCTSYGREQTKRLVNELAELVPDAFVISGLARGIDTVAHEAALEAGLRTIAVLAGGLQHIYPPENENLADRICQQGALISEFPLATKPVSHNFPIRNRVISGISQGVLVTEASVKSGALITATFGQEQNREVFAVPGRIDSHPSSGCNQLISRNQAKLITSATEILEDLLPSISNKAGIQLSFPEPSKLVQLPRSEFNEQQIMILDILNEDAQDLDNLGLITEGGPQQLLPLLLEMELQGWIQVLPGGHYEKNPSIEIVP